MLIFVQLICIVTTPAHLDYSGEAQADDETFSIIDNVVHTLNSDKTYDEPLNSAGDHLGVHMDVDPHLFVHASHVGSSSKSIIHNHILVEAHHDHSLSIIEDNFYRSKQTGIHVSVFHPSEESV